MHVTNLVVLRGRLSSDPKERELPSGRRLVHFEVTTPSPPSGPAATVPVVWFDPPRRAAVTTRLAGAEVVVTGSVRRRWFRAGGITQSRTEVVARAVVPADRSVAVERALDAARDALGPTPG